MWAIVYDQVRKNWDVRLLKEVANENKTNVEAGIDKGFLIFGVFDDISSARQNLDRTPKKI